MNRYSFFARTCLVLFSFFSLLFLSACSELYALREIKETQDRQIRDLSAQLSARSDENARLAAQMESQINTLERQLAAARDENRKLQMEQSVREQLLTDENAQLQRQTAELAFELNRYKRLEEVWKARQEESENNLRLKTAELAAAQQEQARLQESVSRMEATLRQEREKSGKTAEELKKAAERQTKASETLQTDLNKAREDLKAAQARVAELEKDNKAWEQMLTEQKALLETAKAASERAKEIEKALEDTRKRLAVAQSKATPAPAETEDQDLRDAFALLRPTLRPLAENNFAAVVRTDRGIAIRLSADYLFRTGSVQLDENALPVLDEIAAILKRFPRKFVEVQGHTDSQPLVMLPFEDNWGLASERALKVVRYFITQSGLAPARIKSVSYSEYRPIPAEEEGASLRRRVEILLTPTP